jgi:hypothetical protein
MPSSDICRSVALVRTDVSEEFIASITLTMEKIRYSETSVLTGTTRHNVPEDGILLVRILNFPYLEISLTKAFIDILGRLHRGKPIITLTIF